VDGWFQLGLKIPSGLSQAVSGRLFDLGSCGLQEEDEEGDVRLMAYFAYVG